MGVLPGNVTTIGLRVPASGNGGVLPSRGGPVGYDTLVGTAQADTLGFAFGVEGAIFGLDGNDLITGTVPGKVGVLLGGKGNDVINSLGGFIYGLGELGNDTLNGSDGIDFLAGNQGADYIFGNAGSDTVVGGKDGDFLVGGPAGLGAGVTGDTDSVAGDRGSDTLYGGVGSDSLFGGQDNDYIDVDPGILSGLTAGVRALVQPGHADGDDTIRGDLGSDTIGRADMFGNKLIYGDRNQSDATGQGNDSIMGGLGNDRIFGEDGNDTLRGGENVTVGGFSGSGFDFIDGGAGDDSINGGPETVRADAPSDTISGGLGNDNIQGETGNDSIDGGIGNDVIDGGADNDTILGNDQSDSLRGGLGNDSIVGGRDADTIEGTSRGRDTLIGFVPGQVGDGTDRFVFDLGDLLGGNLGTTSVTIPNPPVAGQASTVVTGVPNAISLADADVIFNFDAAQDVIDVRELGFPISSVTTPAPVVGGPAPVPGTPVAETRQFGGISNGFAAAPAGGLGALGSINLQSIPAIPGVAAAGAGRANVVVYIERDGVGGFTDNQDIALAILADVATDNLNRAGIII